MATIPVDSLKLYQRLKLSFPDEQASALATVIYALIENRAGRPDYVVQEWMRTKLETKGGFSREQVDVLTEELWSAIEVTRK